jgi:hypothetical protein
VRCGVAQVLKNEGVLQDDVKPQNPVPPMVSTIGCQALKTSGNRFSLSLSASACLSACASLPVCHSGCVSDCACLYLCLSVCLFLSTCLPACLPVSLILRLCGWALQAADSLRSRLLPPGAAAGDGAPQPYKGSGAR